MSQWSDNNHKIWVDVEISVKKHLQAMIDSEMTDNYISQQTVKWLELTSQWVSKLMPVKMINERVEWVTKETHIKIIIQDDSQKLTFNVLESIKYNTILRMLWLHKKNPRIDWISKELYITKEVYDISEQLKMSLSEHKSWDHEISLLKDKQPWWMSLYSMSENQLKKVWNYLNENLKREFIKSLKSLTEYSILFILKKNDIKQLCVNYKQLNEITWWDSYSLLLIEELQDQLDQTKWFISLDLKKAYYWVRMKKDEEWKTVFWTRYKHYKYTVMSFELKNASVIFQRLINDTLRKYLDDFAITYLDDILIYSDDLEAHCRHIQKVLEKLREKVMYVKKLKSKFEIKEIKFLKYIIWPEQIKKNSKKTDTVRNWSLSKKVKKVQAFLELTNYYWKFVPNYARIAEPLMCLTCKNKRWHWDKEQKNVFCTLKKSLSEMTHLQILNSACEKILKTDASDFAVEACLYQIEDRQ